MKSQISSLASAFAVLALSTASVMRIAAQAQTSEGKTSSIKSYEIEVPDTKEWVDTNIEVRGGAKLRLTATGQIADPADQSYSGRSRTLGTFGPDGLARGFAHLIHKYVVPDAGHGALIGRIGSDPYAQAFLVGASKEYVVPVAGRLFLGINQSVSEASTATGSFHAKIEVLDEGLSSAANVGGPVETPIAGVTQGLISKIPRRISDPAGKTGDMVNVLILGSQDQIVQAFTTAACVKVDNKVGNTAQNAVMDSVEKKDYLTMPMSTLFLFGRAQDYGFARAEAVRVAMSRNHLRVRKSPYEVDGRPL